jgi:spore germination protein
MGNTIGIVGGLIIGQAAVEANLVSPIVVIVVAFTALCSFAIPNEEFAFSFRILKFLIIALSSWFGFFGFLTGIFWVLVHMASLKSFNVPYLTPYVGAQLNGYQDEKDSLVRFPLRMLWKRPLYARESERVKLRKKSDKEHR